VSSETSTTWKGRPVDAAALGSGVDSSARREHDQTAAASAKASHQHNKRRQPVGAAADGLVSEGAEGCIRL